MIRISNGECDYEAATVDVEAKAISRPVKFRRSNSHHASQIDARGDVAITIVRQYLNQSDDARRPREGTILRGDRFLIDGRKVVHLGNNGTRRLDRASVSMFVRMFRYR